MGFFSGGLLLKNTTHPSLDLLEFPFVSSLCRVVPYNFFGFLLLMFFNLVLLGCTVVGFHTRQVRESCSGIH
jgi:hypothetical protein